MKRNTLLIVVVAIAGFFLLFNPLKWFNRNPNVVNRPVATAAQMTPLLEFAQSHWRSPEDYLISSFAQHDIVMLGEIYKIKDGDTLELIAKAKYGNGALWPEISKLNPDLDPIHLKIGREIVLPAAADLRRPTPASGPASRPTGGRRTTPSPAPAPAPAPSPTGRPGFN